MKKIFYTVFSLMILGTTFVSCSKDALEPELSVDRDLENNPLKTVADLESALTGVYQTMTHFTYYGREVILYNEVRTDNAYSMGYSNRFLNVSQFALTPTQVYPTNTWKQIYKVINNANLAIAADIEEGDKASIDNLKGQALAVRALAHFDLLKLYGQQHVDKSADALGVPYILKFAELDMEKYKRKTFRENRDLIYADIDMAISMLDEGSSNVTRISKQAAYGLKSRMALYFASYFPQDYSLAKDAAEKAMEFGGQIVERAAYEASFSGELQGNSVFELAQDGTFNQGTDAIFYVYSYDGYGDIVVHPDVLDLFGDSDDIRHSDKMIAEDVDGDLRNIGKYPKMDANIRIMRYEEIVLNYIEAAFNVNSGDVMALDLMNAIAGQRELVFDEVEDKDIPLQYTSLTLDIIQTERRKELIFEGFRFDDLMRTKKDVPQNPQIAGDVVYGDPMLAFPIPQNEINISKIQPNKGY